jgi:ferredoxin
MDVRLLKLIYFSPTGTTRKTLDAIAAAVRPGGADDRIDLTLPGALDRRFAELHDELAIIGVPVYSGRVPPGAVERLRRLRAVNTPAVIVAVYGNRAYEDALRELRDVAVETGFRPVAAGAFIGEHALLPLADGRPDAKDLEIARTFGEKIRDKLASIKTPDEIAPLEVPGGFPYVVKPSVRTTIKFPATSKALCTSCGDCAAACPTASIVVDERVVTNDESCVLCGACVKACPSGARVIDAPRYRQDAPPLSEDYLRRKEPEIFI